jgi:hypothetical protein
MVEELSALFSELWRDLAKSFGAAQLERLATTIGALHRELVGPEAPLLLEPRVVTRARGRKR